MNQFVPKLFDCMKGYSKEQFVKDVIAGIIVAIIALPVSDRNRVFTRQFLPDLSFRFWAEAVCRLQDRPPHLQRL
jgi:hypothetical protein